MPPSKPPSTTTPRCRHGTSCPYRLKCKYAHPEEELALFDDDNDMDNFLAGNNAKSVVACALKDCYPDCHRLGRCICNDMDYWCGTEDYGEGKEEEKEEWEAFNTDDEKWHDLSNLEHDNEWVKTCTRTGDTYYVNTSTWETMWDIYDHDPDDDDTSPNKPPQVEKIKRKECEDK